MKSKRGKIPFLTAGMLALLAAFNFLACSEKGKEQPAPPDPMSFGQEYAGYWKTPEEQAWTPYSVLALEIKRDDTVVYHFTYPTEPLVLGKVDNKTEVHATPEAIEALNSLGGNFESFALAFWGKGEGQLLVTQNIEFATEGASPSTVRETVERITRASYFDLVAERSFLLTKDRELQENLLGHWQLPNPSTNDGVSAASIFSDTIEISEETIIQEETSYTYTVALGHLIISPDSPGAPTIDPVQVEQTEGDNNKITLFRTSYIMEGRQKVTPQKITVTYERVENQNNSAE